MKKIKYILLIALSAAAISGCTKDKGNYVYNEVVGVTIDPIPLGIVLEQFGNYKLELDMTFSKKDYTYDDFDYLWTAYKWDAGTGVSAGPNDIDTLSRERILDAMIALPANQYKLTFKVTEKKSGVYTSVSGNMKVINGASQGYVILCNEGGFAEVNFINSLGEVKRKVFEGINGKKAGKNPIGLNFSQNQAVTPKILYVRCEDETGGSLMSPLDFSEFTTINNLFSIKPQKMKPQKIDVVGYKNYEVMVNDGVLYCRDLSKNDVYSVYWNPIYGDFYLSEFVFSNAVNSTVIYDNQNKKFIRFTTIQPNQNPSPASINVAADPPFDPNNMGMEMLEGYMVGTVYYSINNGRAVMKDNDGKYYLVSFTLSGGTFTPQRKLEITDEGIAQATSFAFTTDGGFAYYNIGNKVAYSSFTTGNHIKTYSDLIPTGHTIDKLRIDVDFKKTELCVTTNDGTGSSTSGSVFLFTIASDGTLTKKAEYLNCCGKVVDVLYKQ